MPGGGGGGGTPPNPPLLVGGAIPGGGNMPYTFIRFEQKGNCNGEIRNIYHTKQLWINKHREMNLQGAMSCLGAEGEAAVPSFREAAFLS